MQDNDSWAIDRVYTYEQRGEWFVFTSPDGVGRVYHRNERVAMEETGIRSVVHLVGYDPDN